MVDLIYIFSYKSLTKSIFKTENFFKNKYLFLAIAYGFILILAAVYLPFLNSAMKTASLNPNQWLIAFSLSVLVAFSIEMVK